MPAYINIKKKKKKENCTQTDYWGKKTLGTVEINVKMLWTKHFF